MVSIALWTCIRKASLSKLLASMMILKKARFVGLKLLLIRRANQGEYLTYSSLVWGLVLTLCRNIQYYADKVHALIMLE